MYQISLVKFDQCNHIQISIFLTLKELVTIKIVKETV